MKIVAPIPVFGRFPLVKITAERLIKQGVTPILVGHELETKQLAEDLNIEFVNHKNSPLGAKWNAGFIAAKKYNPDAVLFVGSSDWISDSYIKRLKENIEDFDLLGQLGCHFVDVSETIRLVNWQGYGKGQRENEPIGIGRCLSKSFLNTINYKPFEDNINAGLDWSMWKKAIFNGVKIGILEQDSKIELLSISTNRWQNKHKFDDHWSGKLASTKCRKTKLNANFKEIFEL